MLANFFENKSYFCCAFRPNTSVSVKQDGSTHRNFATTIKERNEHFLKNEKDSDYGYTSSRFRPIDKDVSGAKAIQVQDIPNGALGRPVEFESELCKIWYGSDE